MKNFFKILLFCVLASNIAFAQNVPSGMKYQAVARNTAGIVMPNRLITMRIDLKNSQLKGNQTYYTEEHSVTTNQMGLFDLVVGAGNVTKGQFKDIPWSSEDIWMAVSIKDAGKDADFTAVSESKLLAVPYAYYAVTASRLLNSSSSKLAEPDPGVPANTWSLQGNISSDANRDRLGTTDFVDLVVITNNLERMRILANGNITMKRSLNIGANITVDSSAYFNKTAGETFNYGPFTVDRESPTLLSGTLTVDGATDLNNSLNVDGPTDLNSRLFVNNASPTKLTGTLQVDGVTDLNNSFFVNNISPSVLTGTLRVDKDANFKEFVLLDGDRGTHESTSTTTGALVIYGGLGLGGNLNVGGESAFGGPVTFAAAVNISDLTESTSRTTGALIVSGGVGIGKRLNVGGDGLFESKLGVVGLASSTNITESTTFSNGSLTLAGGAGFAKNLNIGGAFTSVGASIIGVGTSALTSKLAVYSSNSYAANFVNSGLNGINIQVGSNPVNSANDFVTFRKSNGDIVGRIEGQTLGELNADPDYVNEKNAFIFSVVTNSVDLAIAGFEVAQGVVDVIAAASSSTACVGLGVCVTAPIPSFIIASGTSLVLKIANAASEATSLAGAIIYRDNYVTNKESKVGITFQSGSADYAEWLPKSNKAEKFMAGYIVGMKNGAISLNTSEADKLFAISTKPIVLGNMPETGQEANFERVAFMGQVPVHVFGKVKTGDYILPSGKNNGFGMAVTPSNMKAEDYDKIVGVAWSESKSDGYGQVNVAIGLNSGEISRVVTKQNKEITELKSKIKETNFILAKLVPGFAKEARLTAEEIGSPIPNTPVTPTVNLHETTHSTSGNIVYFEITNEQEKAMFAMAEKLFVENGGDINTHPFWSKMKSDSNYKESMFQEVKNKFAKALHTHQDINNKYLNK